MRLISKQMKFKLLRLACVPFKMDIFFPVTPAVRLPVSDRQEKKRGEEGIIAHVIPRIHHIPAMKAHQLPREALLQGW